MAENENADKPRRDLTTKKLFTLRTESENHSDSFSQNKDGFQRQTLLPLSRPLGSLEVAYHRYYLIGDEISSSLFKMSSATDISFDVFKHSMYCLAKRHPLLRMTIQEKTTSGKQWFYYVEMEEMRIDLSFVSNSDWQGVLENEMMRKLDVSCGPLWSCTYLHCPAIATGNDVNQPYSLQFTFALHHCIADFGYNCQLFSDFLQFLDNNSKEMIHLDSVKSLEFMPAIETVLGLPDGFTQRNRSTATGSDNVSNAALKLYQKHFISEITLLSPNRNIPRAIFYSFSRLETKTFLRKCKDNSATVTGAQMAAACMAFGRLLRQESGDTTLDIPLEYLVDMRRYIPEISTKRVFHGVAATHVPAVVSVGLRDEARTNRSFWVLARTCTKQIHDDLSSGKVLEVLRSESFCEVPEPGNKVTKGKSSFVLCVTNGGIANDLVIPELKDKFSMVSSHGYSSMLVEDMPIFLVGGSTLDGSFAGEIVYCTSYTSSETAAQYLNYYMSYLKDFSKL